VAVKSFRKHDGSVKLNLDLHDIYTVVMRSSPRFARSSTKRSLIRLGSWRSFPGRALDS
jgi:hypothetical protein